MTDPETRDSVTNLAAVPQPRDWLTRLGQNVRAFRETAGLRQADLADQVGVSRASIANIEAGRQDTTVTVLLALADAFDTTTVTLLGEDVEQPAVPLSLLARIADGQRRIAGAFTEAAVLMERMGQDADEMRTRIDALAQEG